MAAEASDSDVTADSYIGSLISLTSKSEIRYEGVLFNIDTEKSNIGLSNVRSFGTEGRRRDGPQVPPSDKVYEYILFRGSDIKDLQVKSSPPVRNRTNIHEDPAIIQSDYSQAITTSTHTSESKLQSPTFQGSLPSYQSMPSPAASGGGLAMPMYWQGSVGPPPNWPQAQNLQSSMLPGPSTFVTSGPTPAGAMLKEASTPYLVTPGRFLQPGPSIISLTGQSSQMAQKEVVQIQSSELPLVKPAETQAPILPLSSPPDKSTGFASVASQLHTGGHERGIGDGISHPVTSYTEEFDFMAMNEKFKKDEVWGDLGKSNISQDNGDKNEDEDDIGSSKLGMKPVYVKDDFFDSISCNAIDYAQGNARSRFSECRKIDTETFGDVPRYQGGRGGSGAGHSARVHGGYYGRGYGYTGRGRGYSY